MGQTYYSYYSYDKYYKYYFENEMKQQDTLNTRSLNMDFW